MKKKIFILLATITVATLTIGFALLSPAQGQASFVRTLTVERGYVASSIRVTGTVRSTKDVPIVTPFAGRIAELSLAVGDTVVKGASLFRIDDQEARIQVEAGEAALQEADEIVAQGKRNLQALRAVWEAGGEPRNAVTEAEARLRMDEAKAKKSEADLRLTKMKFTQYVSRAPVSGTVASVDADRGQFVQGGFQVMRVTTTDSLEILAKVDQGDTPLIHPDMPVEISVDSASGTVTERVLRIDPVIHKDGATDYLPVWISVTPGKTKLRPNQQVDVKIVTEARNAVLRLPIEALITKNGQDHVWIVQEGKLHLQQIKTGVYGDRHVEILSGLKDTQQVVVLDDRPLKEGDAVAVTVAGH